MLSRTRPLAARAVHAFGRRSLDRDEAAAVMRVVMAGEATRDRSAGS
jgi:anthranilate phosphoribosyltransferase